MFALWSEPFCAPTGARCGVLADELKGIVVRWRLELTVRRDSVAWRILPILLAQPAVTSRLVQERIDIINYITNNDEAAFGMLQQEFVHHAASYGARKNISYAAWRACGVSAPVLTQAGIK